MKFQDRFKSVSTVNVVADEGASGVAQNIKSSYDVLHSTGQGYIVEDIDLYINSRKN